MTTSDGKAMRSKSATVVTLRDYRIGRKALFFTRAEMNQLLGLYSRSVARGEWRDYAIDQRDGQALFSVFRHTHESPLYTIVKTAMAPGGAAEFVVMSGRQKLRAGPSLAEVLDMFPARLALVAPGSASA